MRIILSDNLVRNDSYQKNDVKNIMVISSEILIHIPKEKKHITGEPIRGIVKFHLDKDTVYKKISLSLVEKGYCSWYEHEHKYRAYGDYQAPHRIKTGNRYFFEGHETNIITKIYLLNKNIDETLSAGSYEHPFEIVIPENIPPSIKTDVGEIKYKLVLKFKKPEIFSWNKSFKRKITIYPRIDSSITDEPIIATLDKSLFKLFSTKKHEIKVNVELDKEYLIPSGARNIISFNVTNNSDVIVSVKTELISYTKYIDDYGYKKTKKGEVDYCTVNTPSIPDNSVSNMYNIMPVAPDLCTVRNSKIIQREYKLKVTLKLPKPHINSSVEIPVFVGEKLNNDNYEEASGSTEPMEDPPFYWEAMYEDKSKE